MLVVEPKSCSRPLCMPQLASYSGTSAAGGFSQNQLGPEYDVPGQ